MSLEESPKEAVTARELRVRIEVLAYVAQPEDSLQARELDAAFTGDLFKAYEGALGSLPPNTTGGAARMLLSGGATEPGPRRSSFVTRGVARDVVAHAIARNSKVNNLWETEDSRLNHERGMKWPRVRRIFSRMLKGSASR